MHCVKEEMTHRVAFVLETDDLESAYLSMRAVNARHLPVIRDNRVVGILSDRDILLHSKAGKHGEIMVPKKEVGSVMTKEVIVCHLTDSIEAIAEVMVDKKIDSLPVVDSQGALAGIITSTDLLRLLRDEFPHKPMVYDRLDVGVRH